MTYKEAIEKVKNGAKYKADFKNRTLSVDGRPVSIDCHADFRKFHDLDEWLDHAEDFYDGYKYSNPGIEPCNVSGRFRALTADELVKECGRSAMFTTTSRYVAQAKLELFILFSLANGSFRPEELFRKDWFYQGSDKWFVMIKSWF